jgi:hypothetical protein
MINEGEPETRSGFPSNYRQKIRFIELRPFVGEQQACTRFTYYSSKQKAYFSPKILIRSLCLVHEVQHNLLGNLQGWSDRIQASLGNCVLHEI